MKKNRFGTVALLACLCGLLLLTTSFSLDKTSTSNNEKTTILNTNFSPSGLWLDLVTPNIAESQRFYGKVFGWTFQSYNFKGYNHAHILSNGSIIGGMIEVKGAQSSTWFGSYPVALENFKSLKKGIEATGLKAALNLSNIPERGNQVIFESPLGEEFALILENEITAKVTNTESKNTWLGMELWSSDVEKSKSFYEKAFGVEVSQKNVNNKPYWVFTAQGTTVAGMIKNPVKNQGSQWVPYIKGSNLDGFVKSINASSGTVLLEPTMEVRSGNVILAQDPNGAIFAIQKTN